MCRLSYLFSSSFFRPKRHFCCLEDANAHRKDQRKKKKKNCCSVFVVVFCGVKRKVSKCLERGRERRKDGLVREMLWDLIVNNDDICFKHILPRLNSN